MRRLGLVLALTLVGGGIAAADNTQHQTQDQTMKTRTGVTDKDQEFATKAAQGGLAEVKLSKLAMDRAQSMEVKHFARKMVEDHSKANTELKQIAEKQNLTLPTSLDDKHQDTYQKLSQLRGADFDKEYMKAMADDHDDTVKLLRNEIDNGQNPQLKSFASKTLPVVQRHDEMVKSQKPAIDQEKSKSMNENK